MTERTPSHPIRQDIQVWRAVAVLAVILFHLDLLPGGRGYLGVDVFFVISGYLIGGRLEDAGQVGWRGMVAFWRRRIVRLWPAAGLVMLFSWAAARLVLDRYEYHAFLWQLLGGSTLAANITLWRQISYFSHDAAIKPLLHMWSLAVEEQFYLLLPFVFRLPRGRLAVTGLLTLFSFGIWIYARDHAPSSAFYLLPARAWELGAGVVACLAQRRWRAAWEARRLCPAWLDWPVGAALILLLTTGERWCPEALAMIASVKLTAILLIRPGQGAPVEQARHWPIRLLVALGDRSYALYLVHWPLIAFAHNLWMKALPAAWVAGIAVATFVLGDLLYRAVDRRRRPERAWRLWFALHAGLALAAAGAIALTPASVRQGGFRQANEGLGEGCNKAASFDPATACRSGPHPAVLVWGDSYAMQLVPGLAAAIPGGVMQATHVVCGPFADVAPTNAAYPDAWAQGCLRWNASVIDALRRDPHIRVVVMASILNQYVEAGEAGWQAVRPQGGTGPRDDGLLARDLRRTIATIRAMGKKVLFYRPQPYADFDIGRCLARRMDGLWVMDAAGDCGFAADAAIPVAVDRWLMGALNGAQEAERPMLIDPWPVLCPAGRCAARRDGIPLFADRVHLSAPGSVWLFGRPGMGAALPVGPLSKNPDMVNPGA